MTSFSRTLLLVLALLTATPAFPAGPELLLALLRPNTQYATTTFDDGTAQGWTLGSGSLATDSSHSPSYAYKSDFVYIGVSDSISKTVTCANGTASFWFRYQTSDVSPRAYVNGAQQTLSAGAVLGAWTQYTFPVTAGSNTIRIDFIGTGAGSLGWVDDIKIPIPLTVAKPAAGTPLRTDGHWSVTGLVGAWPLNEGSGTTVTNVVTGATGTLTNAAFVSGGVSANANGRIETNTTIPATYTIITEASFAGTLSDTVFGTNASETSATALAVITASSLYQYYFRGIVQTSSGASMTPGTSDVIALTKSGTTYALYKNGVAGTPVTRAESMTTNTLHLGNTGEVRTGQAKTFGWALMYDHVLSASEIASLAANPWQIFAGY